MQGLPLPGESRAVEDRMISCRGVTKTYVVRERAGLFRRGVRREIEALRGLSAITPAVSTHGEQWVYACKDAVMAALFLSGVGGDLTCAVGREEETGLPFVCERFAGAFEHRYAGARGSVYTLPADTFVEGETGWEEEVVSPVAVRPIAERVVGDVLLYMEELAEQGLLRIYRYPSRPPDVSADDEDLVMRGIVWTRARGEAVLDSFQSYHPHLVERIRQGLAAGRCSRGFPCDDQD